MTITKARPWLIGLTALVTMLVLIGAVGNQGVTDAILRHNVDTNDFGSNFLRSLGIYGWRFSPLGSTDFGHFWLASLIFDGCVLALTLLLTAAVARGSGSFGQIFLSAWMSVVMATALSSYVRGAVIDSKEAVPGQNSKPVVIFFSNFSANAYTVFVALLFGLVTALAAAVVGVVTRRAEVLGAPAAPGYTGPYDVPTGVQSDAGERPPAREPWTAPPAPVPGPVVTPSPWTEPEGGDQPTTTLPAADAPERDESATTELPRADEPEQHTTELPRENRE